MKKVPVFIFLPMFAVMLTACGTESVEIQNTSMQKTEDVSPLPEEENTPENETETGEEEPVEDGGTSSADILITIGDVIVTRVYRYRGWIRKSCIRPCLRYAAFTWRVWHKPLILPRWSGMFGISQVQYVQMKKVLAWNGKMLKRILNIAVPNVVENGLFQLSKVALSSIVALFGAVQIAANGVAQSFWSMASLFCIAFGYAFVIMKTVNRKKWWNENGKERRQSSNHDDVMCSMWKMQQKLSGTYQYYRGIKNLWGIPVRGYTDIGKAE